MKKITFLAKITLVFLLASAMTVVAQTQKISGLVKDNTGAPMIGVSVVVPGTTVGAATDAAGKYTISVPAGTTKLVFGFVGYKDQTIDINSRKVIDVTMESDDFSLDEVVVVGYGTQKKRDITGAITSISADDIAISQPVSIFDALQGAAPGVVVISDSGAPGSNGSTVRIRGTSTIEGGTAPLYIVDGVPQEDITNLNPSDVKSMEVLKDAASAAIYGSRSANGVIIITTNAGDEGAPRVDVRYLHSFGIQGKTLPQANSDDRRAFEMRAKGTSLVNDKTDSLSYGYSFQNYDYQDMVSQLANKDQVDVSISGGTEKFKYMASMGYLDETGIIKFSDNMRYTGRINATYNATDKLSFNSRVSYSYQKANQINEGNLYGNAMKRPSYFAMFYPDGGYIYDNGGQKNIMALIDQEINERKYYNLSLYQGVTYKIIDGLTLNADVNSTFRVNRVLDQTMNELGKNNIGALTDKMQFNQMIMGEAFLSYDKTFAKDHSLNAVVGATAQNWKNEYMQFDGDDLISNDIFTSNTIKTLSMSNSKSSASANSLVGLFARVGYSYKGKYLMNATIRRDGSSRFIENKWGTFPSVSLGWRFSDEPFMDWSKSWLSDAKLRASYGVTGNQAIGNYDAVSVYSFGSYFYQAETGVSTPSLLGNPDLIWETTSQTNFGLDLTLLDGRVSVVADYYDKKTKDLLYSQQIPAETGYTTMKMNFGQIDNSGVEIQVSGYPIKNQDFQWQTSVSYSINRNEVVDLAVPTGSYVASSAWLVSEGQPLGQLYGYTALGVYSYGESNAYVKTTAEDGTVSYGDRLVPTFERDSYNNVILSKEGKPTLTGYTYKDGTPYTGDESTIGKMRVGTTNLGQGDMIWEDLDGNGVIDDQDRKVLGDGYPSWVGSWTNNFRYKQFNLSFSFYCSWGAQIFNRALYNTATMSSNNATPLPHVIYNSWAFPGQETVWPEPKKKPVNNTARILSSNFVEDGSYLRLSNVRLSYTFKKDLIEKLGLGGMMVYAYANDLMTWTNYSGYDPEFTSGALTPGDDTGKYPRRKEIGLGLNVNF